MRRGEVAGLRWVDVDLDAGRVSPRRPQVVVNYKVVVSEPKTAKARRSLALDRATVAALREHRRRQLEERLAVGPQWEDSGLVFTWPDGRPLHPERMRLGHANIAITMDTYSHVLPGLDAQAAGTVARLILGERRHGKRSDDKTLTTGPRAPRRRREVKGEPAGQGWGDRGDSNPRPSGPQPDALTN